MSATVSIKVKRLLLLILAALSLSGCVTLSDPEASQEFTDQAVGSLSPNVTVGQTVVSHRPGLNSVTVWLTQAANPASPGALTLSLFYTPQDSAPLYTTTVSAASISQNTPLNIGIPVQKAPADQAYYLLLQSTDASLSVMGSDPGSYPRGTAYQDGQPTQADIAFKLSYAYGLPAFLQDLQTWVSQVWLILPLSLVLFLPGWLLIDIFNLRRYFSGLGQCSLALALSLAAFPILLLWTTRLGIHWTARHLLFLFGLLSTLALVRLLQTWLSPRLPAVARMPQPQDTPAEPGAPKTSLWGGAALLIIFLSTLAVRLIMVRDLATPAWVDSVHHSLIARLIMQNGAYPANYLPYWDTDPTFYHPGFHSLLALFSWLSALDVSRALLIFGQVLNALSVLSVYQFTASLTKDQPAALVAAVVVGLMSPMPAYYASWGRYTQLAALLVLPALPALWTIQPASPKDRWKFIALISLLVAGIFMLHYRVLAFAVALLIPWLVISWFRQLGEFPPLRFRSFKDLFWIAFIAALFTLPWLVPALQRTFLPRLLPANPSPVRFFSDFTWQYLTAALGRQAIALAGLGLLWSILRRRWSGLLLAVWIALMFLLANLDAMQLPGAGWINNTSVEISLFIPMAALAGYFLSQVHHSWQSIVPTWAKRVSTFAMTMALLASAVFGARLLIPLINPVTILSRQADLPALAWVGENIASDERIAIDPFLWGYGNYAGSDGGYWIAPLAGNNTLPPPLLYGTGSSAARNEINQTSQQVIALARQPAALREYLLSRDIRYIFVGARGGAFNAQLFAADPDFRVLYKAQGAWVFELLP